MFAAGMACGFVTFAQASTMSPGAGVPEAQLLQPLSQWEVIPSDTQCKVERSYGQSATPTSVGFRESISADSFELIVTGIGDESAVPEELDGSLNASDISIRRWSLHKTNVYKFRLTSSEMSQVAAASQVTVQVHGAPQQSFAVAGLDDFLRQLQQCTAALRYKWHMGRAYAGEMGARGDVRSIVQAAIPAWTRTHMRSGAVQFILLVDESGKVVDCDVHGGPGAPLLEELGCELLRREATFQPARDARGAAMKDNYLTPFVVVP